MSHDSIQELRGRLQKLREHQIEAMQDAVHMGLSPKAAAECEFRRELISKLVDKLTELYKPGADASAQTQSA